MGSSSSDVNIDDLRLPQAVVARIAKEALPSNVAVSKEARIAIARAASVFILHATNFANEAAVNAKRKTITAPDILYAVKQLECDELEQPVREAVELWKSSRQQKAVESKKRRASKADNPSNGAHDAAEDGIAEENAEIGQDDENAGGLAEMEGDPNASDDALSDTEERDAGGAKTSSAVDGQDGSDNEVDEHEDTRENA